MLTTYDDIWKEFLVNCRTDDINLPNTQEKIRDIIVSAVKHYNNRVSTNIHCDNDTETLDKELDDNELIIIAHYIRLTFLKNQLTDFSTIWTPFSGDIGIKNTQAQLNSLKYLVDDELSTIGRLIFYSSDDFM